MHRNLIKAVTRFGNTGKGGEILIQGKRETGITALYERLSRDDETAGESNSIQNQKKYLEDYARQNGFTNIRHYSDDGYTGTNFNRPGFQQMLSDIDAGLIATVIVKDMSRFGRNYLEVGLYTDIHFPEKGVRFIAINSNVDSDNPTENEFTPFLNVINEWYAKDTSRKICAIFKSRMAEGLRCSGSVPYGYTRLPGDKQTLVVDPEAAAIVKRIFEMAAQGMNAPSIARKLTEEEVLIPSAYAAKYHPEAVHSKSFTDQCLWSPHAVRSILDREEYLGNTILGKSVRINFRSKKRRPTTQDERLFFPNTHEAIIDQDTWDQAQKLRKRCTRRSPSGTHTHMLFGLAYCPDCGSKLALIRNRTNGTDYNYSFRCRHYRSIYHDCSIHSISATALTEAVRLALKVVAATALEDVDAFKEKLTQQWAEQHSATLTESKKELTAARKRIAELDGLIRGLYEDRQLGNMPARQVDRLIVQYDQEQEVLETKVSSLEAKIEEEKSGRSDPEHFLKAIRKYRDFDELTQDMVFELIDRVDVHQAEKDKVTGERIQQIDVTFSFIGSYEPSAEAVAYEIAQMREKKAAEKAQRKRTQSAQAKQREKERKVQRRIEREEQAKCDPEAAALLEAEKEKKREYNRAYQQKRREAKRQEAIANGTYVPPNPFASMSQKELARIADGNPAAAEELEKRRAYGKAKQAQYRAKAKERASTDPEFAAKLKAKNSAAHVKAKEKMDDLAKRAKTDPEAAAELEAKIASRRKASRDFAERQKQKAATDPEFAREYEAKKQEKQRKHNEKQKQKRAELRAQAEIDPKAAEELAAQRAKQVEASTRSRHKLNTAALSDPLAAAKREQHLAHRREYYASHKL